MQHLVDGDLASNNHGWQWAAGTGTDAAPYFRVFNPTFSRSATTPTASTSHGGVPIPVEPMLTTRPNATKPSADSSPSLSQAPSPGGPPRSLGPGGEPRAVNGWLAVGRLECQMLDDRKTTILSAVVQEYIATAQPVGSGHIAEAPTVNVSSATVRNEMAHLEHEGYLVQPHTSAGRIPTDKGYRYFVDHLTKPGRLDTATTRQVGEFF